MTTYNSYPNIDLAKTGKHLKKLIRQRNYSVKEIQELLNLSCPQPIYRWFKGQGMPSVDHLYVLSKLLCMHMEDLLIPEPERKEVDKLMPEKKEYLLFLIKRGKHLLRYRKKVQGLA